MSEIEIYRDQDNQTQSTVKESLTTENVGKQLISRKITTTRGIPGKSNYPEIPDSSKRNTQLVPF